VAAENRSDLVALDRPRKIAARLVERFGLAPPIDIRALIERYAEIEETSVPADCDALVIGLNQPTVVLPRVIINRSKPRRRQRFSMGHELGHILIPGHVGLEVCFMEDAFYDTSSDYEREAHAFASEVLMPTQWLTGLVNDSTDAGDVFTAAEVADVSAAAAMLAISRVLPPGHVVALMAPGLIVDMALASPGTVAKVPREGEALDRRSIDPFAADGGALRFSGRGINWWAFEAEIGLPEETDERTASEVLREIVNEIFAGNPERRQHTLASINGVASHAKMGFEPAASDEEMLARLQARLAGRNEHLAVTSHPLFGTFLAKKARELRRNN
jgi:IrrE N-terminal-like domain